MINSQQLDVKTAKLIVRKHYEKVRDLKDDQRFQISFVLGAGPLECATKKEAEEFFLAVHKLLSDQFPEDAGIMLKLDFQRVDSWQQEFEKSVNDGISASIEFERSLMQAKFEEAKKNADKVKTAIIEKA